MVNWYLKEIESDIDSEEELVNKKGLIEKVLHRLVHYVSPPAAEVTPTVTLHRRDLTHVCLLPPQDHILIELTPAVLKGSQPAMTEAEEEVVLVVNPNYTLED